MEEEEESSEESSGGGGINAETIRSYLAFLGRALRSRKALIGTIAISGLALTLLAARFLPKTYSCTTVMMTVENAVLDGARGPNSLAGAEGLIMRHENLEALIRETQLVKKYPVRRPALLKAKDRLIASLLGEMDDRTLTAVLVGTLESKLSVSVEDDTLEIKVEWSDPGTAAELAEATKAGFLRIRHKAEISAFQEKMAILDEHATKLREEIDALAAQLKESLQAKADELRRESGSGGATGKTAAAAAPLVRRRVAVTDDALPDMRERLLSSKDKLRSMEAERTNRLTAERIKLDELNVKFTSNHPEVIAQQERVGLASQVPAELAMLRHETTDLERQIKQREAMAKTGQSVPMRGGGGSVASVARSESLPSEILALLDRDDADPAITAQMSGAVVRYGSLRDEVRGAKLALDTEQAAFNHRYQVVIPVEAPSKPDKPKLPVVLGAGIFLTLLLCLVVPVLLELRRGILVERWQVSHFQLPVLAELRLPKRSDS
ncbi:MAG TPA: hypothetical protein VJN18_28790 [Polyangiaceae bacterium]|nr:hypothetical protein [Polyangiaceae bacterium]